VVGGNFGNPVMNGAKFAIRGWVAFTIMMSFPSRRCIEIATVSVLISGMIPGTGSVMLWLV
jgi:hypothetical protein